MAIPHLHLLLLLLLFLLPPPSTATPTPYLSPSTLPQNYQTMLQSFKIYIHTPPKPINYPTAPSSIFYTSLLHSQFITHNPSEADLFFIPFAPETSTRALARIVRDLRSSYPYWNRSLGADHFFLSPSGIDFSSDRNLLELKKNSIQISVFPVTSGLFIPHKDITLPPFSNSNSKSKSKPCVVSNSETPSFLGYLRWNGGLNESKLVNELKEMDDFVVDEDDQSDSEGFEKSKFCLFFYRAGDVSWMPPAMGVGCVPVVIVEGPIQDLPLMDVLRWGEMAMVVKVGSGRRLREVLSGVGEERYREMRELSVVASRHLVWNEEQAGQACDAFHMVVYQLWLRRHVIRYGRREEEITNFSQE